MAARVAVVGHVEWVHFAPVDRVPRPGEIVHAHDPFDEVAGGGAVAAVQLAKLAGGALFFTALGDDEYGRRSAERLAALGVEVQVAWRQEPTRRAFTHVDAAGERTITVLGERMVPRGEDPLAWQRLDEVDAVYFTGGDVAALRAARRARCLVATPRASDALVGSGVPIDALVGSSSDAGEQLDPEELDPLPGVAVATEGARGGRYVRADGTTGRWDAVPLPAPRADAYGCGDAFAAGLTFGLGDGRDLDAALVLGARCGAHALTGAGPYSGQLTLAAL